MYGIDGERDLTEHTLDHLSGYRESQPVRIGNGAYDQQQHDVWGMLLDSVASHSATGGQIGPSTWEALAYLVDVGDREVRTNPTRASGRCAGRPQHFVASKVMCWVAADRGIRLARDRDDSERAEVAEGRRRDEGGDLHEGRRRARRVRAALRRRRRSTRRRC